MGIKLGELFFQVMNFMIAYYALRQTVCNESSMISINSLIFRVQKSIVKIQSAGRCHLLPKQFCAEGVEICLKLSLLSGITGSGRRKNVRRIIFPGFRGKGPGDPVILAGSNENGQN